jgi:hypothetical protein
LAIFFICIPFIPGCFSGADYSVGITTVGMRDEQQTPGCCVAKRDETVWVACLLKLQNPESFHEVGALAAWGICCFGG